MSDVATDAPRLTAAVRVSVVLCCYTLDRWPRILAATESLLAQSLPPAEILLVVDHCDPLRERAIRELPEVRVLDNDGPPGLSSARNVGVDASTGDVVAFLDDDAVAEPEWRGRLASAYADPAVIGVGGQVSPVWESHRPAWFPPEFDWVVGCTHTGMPPEAAVVRNVIGANMSFRREILAAVGGFRADLGRVGSHPAGCEETELCIRATAQFPEGVICYQPEATVHHHVPNTRATWRYFRARCYAEGLSKAAVSRVTGAQRALATERAYVRRVLPRGLAMAAASVNPSRGVALVTGLSATVTGYVVGRYADRQRDAAARARLLAAVAKVTPLVLALGLWLQSLRSVDLAAMTDLGLVSVLPTTYWAALLIVVATVPVLIHRDRTATLLLVAYLAALILILHATPAVLYDSLRYGWAWKHVGVVDYIVRNHSVEPQVGGPFNAYQAWPGFFALNAVVVKAIGLPSALSYAAWGPPLFELAALFPLRLLFSTLSRDRRQVWLALLVFYLGNWVGQDYFSPQAFAYLLYLVILGVCLRWLPASHPDGRLRWWRRWLGRDLPSDAPPSPSQRRALLAVVVLLMLAVASSHQLTPFMLLSALCLLVLGRQTGPAWLPAVLGVVTVAWMVTMGRTFLDQNLYWIIESIGHPGANAQAGLVDLSRTSTDQRLVSYADRGLTAGLVVLAGLGWIRLRRAGAPRRGAALLAISALPLLGANSYGGEMIFRVYLFALPFLALLTAGMVYPRAVGRRLSAAVPVALALVLVAPFCLAYYGKERSNYFNPQEVAASEWLYSHAPAGSLLVGADAQQPWGFTHYADYDYLFLENLPIRQREALTRSPMAQIDQQTKRHPGAIYVMLSRSQAVYARYTGVLPAASLTALTSALEHDPFFHVAYRNPDAVIFVRPQLHTEPSQ
ncbi:MAG: glycosyltransferase family 2 protein [Intrasporangium sp.]|uniref:glycosyltransferase family 2 protein n=1 Tax=Intrasporangium sp. TaxID=1925024 RepID=UPI003F815412